MHCKAEVAVTFDLHSDAVVVALDRYRVVHPGRVALDAYEERVRPRRSVCGQAEVGEDVGAGFAAEHEFFNYSVFVVSFPQ